MSDRLADLEAQINLLKETLDEQTKAKLIAYDDLNDRERYVSTLEQEAITANTALAREGARATALEIEADLYRNRYHKALARMGAVSRAVLIANAARQYIAAIEQRGVSAENIATALTRLAGEVRDAPDETSNPQTDHIVELEGELETLRARIVALNDAHDRLARKADDLEGHAADWQELAEINDRQLVEAQRQVTRWEQWPSEARHVLDHVVDCEDNCRLCRDLAADTLTRIFGDR